MGQAVSLRIELLIRESLLGRFDSDSIRKLPNDFLKPLRYRYLKILFGKLNNVSR